MPSTSTSRSSMAPLKDRYLIETPNGSLNSRPIYIYNLTLTLDSQ